MADNKNSNIKIQNQSVESLEKYFFIYIKENPKYFNRVDSMSFKNHKIKFVYERIQNYYLKSNKSIVPTDHKILELIRLDDPDGDNISSEFLKQLLKVNIGNIVQGEEDDFLVKSFKSWIVVNNMKKGMYDAIDWIRDMNPIDYNNTELISSKLKEAMTFATLMDYDDEDLGLDFFNPDSHIQDLYQSRIPTGWKNIDELLNGGWTRKTLNIFAGGSNTGKSLVLCNIIVNAAEHGKNCLYITLEMSPKDVLKRMGSKWLRIPIDEYDNRSKDKAYMSRKLKEVSERSASFTDDNLFNNAVGQIYVKEFPSGSCSIDDVEAYIKHLEETKGIKIDMVALDYLTIMKPAKADSLFQNGKDLSNGLRAIAQKRDLVMVTAIQVSREVQNGLDMSLSDISESKAIYENADCVFGILRNEAMRKENKYIFKLLKLRNGSFKWERTFLELNTTYLSIENDKKME